MSQDPESVIDQALSHEERTVLALEQIADALTLWAKIEAQRFDKQYPERKPPREATVTRIPSDDDRLREDLGDDGSQTTEEWTNLGPRERALKSRG